MSDPMHLAVRLASGSPLPDDLKHLQRAFANWLDSRGALALERCLHLPCSISAWRIAERDRALCGAAKLLPERTAWGASVRLEREWSEFLCRGPWRFWRGDSDPPRNVAPLNRELFYASTHNRSDCLSAKQIQRVIGHLY